MECKLFLRTKLSELVNEVMDNFSKVTDKKVIMNGEKKMDPSMYTGGGGVLHGLYKYAMLIDKETNNLKPSWLDENINSAMDKNRKYCNSQLISMGGRDFPSF